MRTGFFINQLREKAICVSMNRTQWSLPKYCSLVVLSNGDIFAIDVQGITTDNMLCAFVGGRLFIIKCFCGDEKNISRASKKHY